MIPTVFGIVFVLLFSKPLPAKAGFFDTPSANASTDQSGQTSSTMDLPQAGVSPASIMQDSSSQNTDNTINNIDSNSALSPLTGPLGVSNGTDPTDPSLLDPSFYVVKDGDTLSSISQMFNVSVKTILLANDMKEGDKLSTGTVLFVLPFSGIEYVVKKGDTLQSIAKLYKIDLFGIVAVNDISSDTILAVGDKIMIPNGDMIDEGGDKPAANLGTASTRDADYYKKHPVQNIVDYFINPVPTGHKTQGLHGPGMRGIDIGAPKGTPIYASASGVVIKVVTGCVEGWVGCGGGYGNYVVIQHPNGTKTLYGHMSKVIVSIGQNVDQGEIIGYIGSTGHSTGPHLHFEVFNAKNPGSDWSWKK